jgi:hypothetical protein
MYENNRENREYLIEEEGTREALPEPSAEVLSSDRIPDTDDEITAEELLNHCTCHIVEGHMQWRCDGEVYRDRLADLLKKEPVMELETDSSLDE